MTAKEFRDYIITKMTAEQALLKLLEGQLMEYEKLKFSSEETSIHPVLLISMAAMDMGWNLAIPDPKVSPDEDVRGMIVGTQEYIDSVLKSDGCTQAEEQPKMADEKINIGIDWDSDDFFVIRYQALSHAQGQMTGDVLASTEKWLEENKQRYTNLNKR